MSCSEKCFESSGDARTDLDDVKRTVGDSVSSALHEGWVQGPIGGGLRGWRAERVLSRTGTVGGVLAIGWGRARGIGWGEGGARVGEELNALVREGA